MIRDVEAARDKIADALWWLRGFSAANPENSSIPAGLASDMTEVREYLNLLQHASVRRLGDEKAVVLQYSEFEHLVDASRPGATRDDIAQAATTIRSVLGSYSREAQRARDDANPEIPY